MLLYFAYGSNMSSARLRRRVGNVHIVGVGRLSGYVHRFDKCGADGTAKGNIVVSPRARVLGVLYRIDVQQLETLSEFEGGYRRVELQVHHDRAQVAAVSFAAIAPVTGLTPTREYLGHYRRGLREHGLPDHYARELLGDHAG